MNALEIRGLTKVYDDFRLDNLNLTLPCGCIMGLVGENGAGKSTTIKLILGMIRRNEGSIMLFGQDNRKEIHLLKDDVGVVQDEIGLPEALNAKQIGRIMDGVFGRWDERLYMEYLNKLSIPAGKPFKTFSRGMKMKLGIAIALSHHPKLLILDEATSGLDPVVRDEVVDMFSEFTRDENHAVLISSHIVSDLEKLCDYIAFLHKGRLLICEEKDVLLEQYGVVRCDREQLRSFPAEAVVGKRTTAYGAEALVRRGDIPADIAVSPVSIEELFVFMVREAR